VRVPALLRRLGALFTVPSRGRRIVFVHSDDPWYELCFDGRGQPVQIDVEGGAIVLRFTPPGASGGAS
jgi:hypothetical protein